MNCEKFHEHLIVDVVMNSPADEAGIKPGDKLVFINDRAVEDVLDFHFYEADEEIKLTVKRNDKILEFYIEKDEDEELGLEFESSLMDNYKSCYNKCVFCFIDQNPHGMRETIYFKDDDSRLSFLQGNYITLTNLKEKDVERICYYHLSPINVSIHTTNPELRCKMLNNRFAGDCLRYLEQFKNADITMNGQIVLCKSYNDGEELEKTIHDLTAYLPCMQSLSVVPVGLTDYREGLAKIEPFTKEDAENVLDIIHKWQSICLNYFGTRFVYASDEWYILAEKELPTEEEYEGYMQIENGVGMMRSLIDEVKEELKNHDGDERQRHISIATGKLAAPFISQICEQVNSLYPNVRIDVYTVKNTFFGEKITVAGLLTGGDIISRLKDEKLGDYLLLPANLLRSGENVLLDDVSVSDIENALQTRVRIVQLNGWSFVDMIIE